MDRVTTAHSPGLPDFIGSQRPEERSLGRFALILLLGLPLALLVAAATALLCMLVFGALTSRSFQAVTALTEAAADAGARSLLSHGFELSIAGLSSIAAALVILGIASRVQRRPALSLVTAA